MWPKSPQTHNLVALIVGPHSFSCALLVRGNQGTLLLAAHKSQPLEHVTAATIRSHLKQFVDQHQLAHSFFSIALAPPLIHEELIRLSTASPGITDFHQSSFGQLLWDYQYLHGLDDGNHVFYVRGIKKSVLFEYELLARHTELVLTMVTSTYQAQLDAYARIYGKSFRHSQRALDLIKHNYNISESLNTQTVSQLLKMSSAIAPHTVDIGTQATLIGIYYQ